MNSLSILIYAVEVISNLSSAAWAIFPIFTILTIFLFIIRAGGEVEWDHKGSAREQAEKSDKLASFDAWNNRLRYYRRWTQWVAIVAVISLVLVPNRQTAIMIAASEVAEIVVKSEEAQTVVKDVTGLGTDAVGLLKTYIQTEQKKLMDELKPKEEPKKDKENI